MAQAYAHAQQPRGTLVAGQTISVNKYTVQVERYLSQGQCARGCMHPSSLLLQVDSRTFI